MDLLAKNWSSMTFDEISELKQYFIEVTRIHFTQLGFKLGDRTFSHRRISEWYFVVDCFLPTYALNIVKRDGTESVFFHKYAFFPDIMPSSTHIRFPSPRWGKGFIDACLNRIDDVFIDSINPNIDPFASIRSASQTYRLGRLSQPKTPVSSDTIEAELQALSKYHFDRSVPK